MRESCFGFVFFFQAEDGIRDLTVTGVQTCALPILSDSFCSGTTAAHSGSNGIVKFRSWYLGLGLFVLSLSVLTVALIAGRFPSDHPAPQIAAWVAAYLVILATGLPPLLRFRPISSSQLERLRRAVTPP